MQYLITILIVAGAVVFMIRWVYKKTKAPGVSCCGTEKQANVCSSCPQEMKCDSVSEEGDLK